MHPKIPLAVEPDEKLRWLRRLDGPENWKSLDDRRYCQACGKTFTGRKIRLIGGTRPHGPLRLSCPTGSCQAGPSSWTLPLKVADAPRRSLFEFAKPRVVRVKRTVYRSAAGWGRTEDRISDGNLFLYLAYWLSRNAKRALGIY